MEVFSFQWSVWQLRGRERQEAGMGGDNMLCEALSRLGMG